MFGAAMHPHDWELRRHWDPTAYATTFPCWPSAIVEQSPLIINIPLADMKGWIQTPAFDSPTPSHRMVLTDDGIIDFD